METAWYRGKGFMCGLLFECPRYVTLGAAAQQCAMPFELDGVMLI